MEPVIRVDLAKMLCDSKPLVVELGCGQKKKAGRLGIDIVDMHGVDIVADLEKGLGFLPDNSVDEIHSRSMLEHVDDFELIMKEMIRVLKVDGRAHIFVPHFSNPHYYSDYTHKRFFGLYTFYYFVEPEHQLKRKVPCFYTDIRIKVVSVKLKFRSIFKILKPFKTIFGRIINSHSTVQEYYEENLCNLFPCHGIEIVLRPDAQ